MYKVKKILLLFFLCVNCIIYIIGLLFTIDVASSFFSVNEAKFEISSIVKTQEIKNILSRINMDLTDKKETTPTVVISRDRKLRSMSIFITSGGVVVILDNTGRRGIIGRPRIDDRNVIWEFKSMGVWPEIRLAESFNFSIGNF